MAPSATNSIVPAATYRLEFGPHLTLEAAIKLVDYFDTLGLTTVYSSPLFRAREGSAHGYDVIDHNTIDPALGTEDQFADFARRLAERGLGILLDVVPNHMGIDDAHNRLWQDVLENGRSSPYARFFDIDWNPPKEELRETVLVPVLGDQYGKVLENQELRLSYDDERFYVHYYQRRFPLAPETWPLLLHAALAEHLPDFASDNPARMELESVISSLERLPADGQPDSPAGQERRREQEVARRRLATLTAEEPSIRRALDATLVDFNGKQGDARSFDRLEGLLARQYYRLCHWRVAADEINYRRFFDINELAALHVEDPEVFRAVHAMVFRFLERGWIGGLRIDHPDGLYDPKQYLHDLQQGYREVRSKADAAAQQLLSPNSKNEQVTTGDDRPLYIVVEKILGFDEGLPQDWSAHGTTGYDFLNFLNGIFVDRRSARRIKEVYTAFTGVDLRYFNIYYESKRTVLNVSMSSELFMLARRLDRISEQHRWSRDFTLASLRAVLREAIACFPVYRSYIPAVGAGPSDEDRRRINLALRTAQRRNPGINKSLFDFLKSLLLLENPDGLSPEQIQERREFVMRFQQLTGPVTAKGLEDTAFYRAYPLASLNEVGAEPSHFGVALEEFHRHVSERMRLWPCSMLATSTHDTKRSEDVRARINVLSEIPEDWAKAIERWHGINRPHKSQVDGAEAPDTNEEYLFYQSLVGTWPARATTDDEHQALVDRLTTYMLKAAHEAKLHTSWTSPDEEYDASIERFVRQALDRQAGADFLADFDAFHRRIARAGMVNSLAQTLLKICAPGVCDFYQGQELWDYSLVDPDNRHPVDFELRRRLLDELVRRMAEDRPAAVAELLENWTDGRIKLFLTREALCVRRAHQPLFLQGEYLPLAAEGPAAEHVCAFARRHGSEWAIAVVPRFWLSLSAEAAQRGGDLWAETVLTLPPEAPPAWTDRLAGQPVAAQGGTKLPLGELLRDFPVALLTTDDPGAGSAK